MCTMPTTAWNSKTKYIYAYNANNANNANGMKQQNCKTKYVYNVYNTLKHQDETKLND